MKKLLFCIITLIMMSTNIAFANPLTLNEAKNNALKFFSLENKSITWVKEKQEFEKSITIQNLNLNLLMILQNMNMKLK